MAILLRPVRHAVNNLSMVVSANLDAALPALPEGERLARQVARAREAARSYDRLARGFLALGREETVRPQSAPRVLREILPLLALAAGGNLELEEEGPPATVEARSPALEAALVLAASGAAGRPRPPLRLEGARLHLGWPLPEAARLALHALGAGIEEREGGSAVTLPQPGGRAAS